MAIHPRTSGYEDLKCFPGYTILETEGYEDRDVVFASVNGIFTTLDFAKTNAEHISAVVGHKKVHHFYNESHGKVDLIEAAKQKIFGKETVEKSYNLAMFIMRLMDEKKVLEQDKTLNLIVHSQGGLIARDAEKYIPFVYRKRIQIISLGSPVNFDGMYNEKAKHYGASNDPVYRLSSQTSSSKRYDSGTYNPIKAHGVKHTANTRGLSEFCSEQELELDLKRSVQSILIQLKKRSANINENMPTSKHLEEMIVVLENSLEKFQGMQSADFEKNQETVKEITKRLAHLKKFKEIFQDQDLVKLLDPKNAVLVQQKFIIEYPDSLTI